MAAHRCIIVRGGGEALWVSRGPLSITPGTVIVEVLVGWSPALPYRFPQKRSGVRADFLQAKKKRYYFPDSLEIGIGMLHTYAKI